MCLEKIIQREKQIEEVEKTIIQEGKLNIF
jgi:hypothetical protein